MNMKDGIFNPRRLAVPHMILQGPDEVTEGIGMLFDIFPVVINQMSACLGSQQHLLWMQVVEFVRIVVISYASAQLALMEYFAAEPNMSSDNLGKPLQRVLVNVCLYLAHLEPIEDVKRALDPFLEE